MRRLSLFAALMTLSASALATQTTANADDYSAVAYFTSRIVDGGPTDRIDTAHLNQDYIVLHVDWNRMKPRSYRTEVRIVDPNGRVVGTIRNIILPASGRYHTYYYYRPGPGDTPGGWTYQVQVDGRDAFEARISVLAAE